MNWILRQAILNGIIYVVLVWVIDIGLRIVANSKGGVGLYLDRPRWFVFFAALWVISYIIATSIPFGPKS